MGNGSIKIYSLKIRKFLILPLLTQFLNIWFFKFLPTDDKQRTDLI